MTLEVIAITVGMSVAVLLAMGQLWGARSRYDTACALLTPATAAALLWAMLSTDSWAIWPAVVLCLAQMGAYWLAQRHGDGSDV